LRARTVQAEALCLWRVCASQRVALPVAYEDVHAWLCGHVGVPAAGAGEAATPWRLAACRETHLLLAELVAAACVFAACMRARPH
jgi:hypothetical protein